MSRIFSISGNFIQNGAWSTPDPSFSGKIVVDDNDKFYGYCDELYGKTMSELWDVQKLILPRRSEYKGYMKLLMKIWYLTSPWSSRLMLVETSSSIIMVLNSSGLKLGELPGFLLQQKIGFCRVICSVVP